VVVLYVTSVSAVRRTAGRCQRVRQTLANLGVEFLERDISMATAYKDELARRVAATAAAKGEGDANDAATEGEESEKEPKKPSSSGKPPTSSGLSSGSSPSELVVPCLFVDDIFVGSGEALDASAADGSLNALLEERGRVGRARAEKDACASCAGQKLVICDRCDGSMRWRVEDKKTGAVLGERRCPWCNEVGMQECGACVPKFARTTK
jgi:glutaredoxin